MRSIKFRIWDNQSKDYTSNDSSFHCYSQWMVDIFSGEIIDAVGTFDGAHVDSSQRTLTHNVGYYFDDSKLIKEPRYKLEQYTEVNDINGREIYEGDIVEISAEEKIDPDSREIHQGYKYTGVVFYNDGGYRVKYNKDLHHVLSSFYNFKLIGNYNFKPTHNLHVL